MIATTTLDLIGKSLWEIRSKWNYEGGTVPILCNDGRFCGGEWPGDQEPKWMLNPVRIDDDGEIVSSEYEECDALQMN
jgi:hypothetical protein